MPYQKYLPFLEKVLTPRRLAHSLGSMQVMGELAEVYSFEVEKAQVIGILHDAGKDLPEEQIQVLVDEGHIQVEHECEMNYLLYLHGPVGAYFIEKELGIKDEVILSAIRTHTYCGDGRYFNNPVSWCLRFADILEPTRRWESEEILLDCARRLKELVYAGQMDAGIYLQTVSLIKWLEEKAMPVHPRMRWIKQDLEGKHGFDETF